LLQEHSEADGKDVENNDQAGHSHRQAEGTTNTHCITKKNEKIRDVKEILVNAVVVLDTVF
jgi:hypothetical protein